MRSIRFGVHYYVIKSIDFCQRKYIYGNCVVYGHLRINLHYYYLFIYFFDFTSFHFQTAFFCNSSYAEIDRAFNDVTFNLMLSSSVTLINIYNCVWIFGFCLIDRNHQVNVICQATHNNSPKFTFTFFFPSSNVLEPTIKEQFVREKKL